MVKKIGQVSRISTTVDNHSFVEKKKKKKKKNSRKKKKKKKIGY